MAITIMLIPLKLLVKALGYIAEAVIRAAAYLFGLVGMLIGMITSFIGGAAIIITVICLACKIVELKEALMYFLYGAGGILFPVLIMAIVKLLFALKTKIRSYVDDLELI